MKVVRARRTEFSALQTDLIGTKGLMTYNLPSSVAVFIVLSIYFALNPGS